MTIRRGITAFVCAVVCLIAVFLPEFVLHELQIMPDWFLAVLPLLLVGVSRAWAADWMLDRPGLGRWLKLALLVGVVRLGWVYASYRAFSVRDIGPGFAFSPAKAGPKDDQANNSTPRPSD